MHKQTITIVSKLIAGIPFMLLSIGCAPNLEDVKDAVENSTAAPRSVALSSATVNVADFGALPNDTVSDTRAFQQAINFVASQGGGTVNVSPGEYYINADTSIVMKSDVTLNMVDTTRQLKAVPTASSRYYIIRIFNVSNVQIIGGKIRGERYQHQGTTGEWGMGIGVYASSHVLISRTRVFDCWGDGVVIGSQGLYNATTPSSYVTIDRVVSNNNRRQGLTIGNADSITVTRCTFSFQNGTAPQTGIDIEPDANGTAKNISITNCVIGNNIKEGILLYGVGTRTIQNIHIEDNTIYENDYWAGNVIGDNTDTTISNVYFSGNTFKDNILVTSGPSNGLDGNKVRKQGICHNCTLSPNEVIVTP